jgi:uncharacterized protein
VPAERKPLLLRGARQVGKTSTIRQLAAMRFKNLVELNLEDRDVLKLLRHELSLKEFLEVVQVSFAADLTKPDTLLFVDEIQQAPWLLELFRFFHEKLPELAVVGSGSLLEVKLRELKLSIPVGRIDNLYMYPLSFFEYLEAVQELELLKFLMAVDWSKPVPAPLHDQGIKHFHRYVILGGMPEICNAYANHKERKAIRQMKANLMTTYVEDVAKYAERQEQDYITHVMENAPLFCGTRYNYEKFAASRFGSKAMQKAFASLERAMILHQAEATDKPDLPIGGQAKRQRKLIFLDVGLVSHRFGLHLESPPFPELSDLFRGQIAEQVVGQHLVARGIAAREKLHFWAKQSTAGAAEVDFILELNGRMVALEVKSGAAGRLRSLISFGSSNQKALLFRVYSGPLTREKRDGLTIRSVPFYLLPRLADLVEAA